MKKLLWVLLLSAVAKTVFAQSELSGDSIREMPAGHKQYGDFLLDMNLFGVPPAPKLRSFDLKGINVTTDYNALFRPDPNRTFGVETSGGLLQRGTFKLNDNMRLNLYGEYSADGRKRPGTSAYPWEKNGFKGGMEWKMNKNFGIRLEVVQKSRYGGYPY